MDKKESLLDIIEYSVVRLNSLLLSSEIEDQETQDYAKILRSYLQNDQASLKRILSANQLSFDVRHLGLLRLGILEENLGDNFLEEIIGYEVKSDILKAEKEFILGTAFLRIKENSEAVKYFKTAYNSLNSIGAKNKALKALMNVVVAESRIDNERRLIGDYEFIAKKASEINNKIIQGLCLHNISKEFQRVNGFELALKYANQSITMMEEDTGALHYYEAILHRCHVLIDLGRYQQAYRDFEKAKLSNHVQIKNALSCIEIILGGNKNSPASYLEPAWHSKLENLKKPLKANQLTKIEMQFVELIRNGEVSKDEVILSLYGDNIDWDAAKNRFKVFLNRFKKKYPNLVVITESGYALSDETILGDIKFVI